MIDLRYFSRPNFAALSVAIVALTGGFLTGMTDGSAESAAPPCKTSVDVVKLAQPLARISSRLAAGMPITIVALGSSSTAGAGASSPAANYPNRLAAELTARFPGHPIRVVNSGANGEEARDMLARFEDSVSSAKPDLVLWQVGTNAVLRDSPFPVQNNLIREGVARMKKLGADVVLIDLQFAPKVIAKPDAEGMVSLIATAAKQENVDLFRRFALMRKWHMEENIPFESFVSPDGLHMNDWSYSCFAKSLSVAIAEAATRPVATAKVR